MPPDFLSCCSRRLCIDYAFALRRADRYAVNYTAAYAYL